MVLDALDQFTLAAHDKGVTVKADIQGDLPEAWVDPVQIGHVFSNLLTNALRYTDPGGMITVSARADDDLLRFVVSDTGKGIPAEFIDKVFEQFFRVPDQDKQTGAGLGLAIVKEIVESHGGTISVTSTEGKGTTFAFTLRRADRSPQKADGL
jgi:signal transduction histidine kinase